MPSIDSFTQSERIAYAEANLVGDDAILKLLARDNILTTYARESSTISGTYYNRIDFITSGTAVHYASMYAKQDTYYVYNSDADSADANLSAPDTRLFIAAGERQSLDLTSRGIDTIDFRTVSAVTTTGRVYVTGFVKGTDAF